MTKRGKPVAKVTMVMEAGKDLHDQLKGSVLKEKDLIRPISV